MKYFDPNLLKPRSKPAMPTNDELTTLIQKLTGHTGPIKVTSVDSLDGLADKLAEVLAGALDGGLLAPVNIIEMNTEIDTPERVVIRGKVTGDKLILLSFNPAVVDTIENYNNLVGLTSDDLFDMFDAFLANPGFKAIGAQLQFAQTMDDESIKCVLMFISRHSDEKFTFSLMFENGYNTTFTTHIDMFPKIDPATFVGMSAKQIQATLSLAGILAVDVRDMQRPGDEEV